MTELLHSTTYYVRAYAMSGLGVSYGEELSFTTLARYYENGHEYVDLGLSVKWATMNVGASSESATGYKFSWGDVVPNRGASWDEYMHCINSPTNLTKYCTDSTYGVVDNQTTLELIDDAAHVHWGGSWRMPTGKEWQELISKCEWSYVVTSKYIRVTSKVPGYTDKSIIIPFSAVTNYPSFVYWSNQLGIASSYAVGFYTAVNHNNIFVPAPCMKNDGLHRVSLYPIRPVCP